MTIYQGGKVNKAAFDVPGVAVVIEPPGQILLNGVATNIGALVGTATWGPTNAQVPGSGMADYGLTFGPMKARKYDMGSHTTLAIAQGMTSFRWVRVTDGTDAAATITVLTNCITFTSLFTGSLANGDQISIGPGRAASSWKAVILRAGRGPEIFDNLAAGLTGNAVWVAIANAINQGIGGMRSASQLISATAGVGTTAPSTATYTLAGGTDGDGIAASALVGVDTTPRTGMYVLRGSKARAAILCDCDTSSTWATQLAFGFAEGIEMIGTGPAGDTISNAVSVKASAGLDNPWFKLMHGDWHYLYDATTAGGVTRLVSPQGAALGMICSLSPEQSPLNKPINGIAGTQKSESNVQYSYAELQLLEAAGIELIANPSPGGFYFGCQFGINTSSDPGTLGDEYTGLTTFIARTIDGGVGKYIGQLQSAEVRRKAKSTLGQFFDNLIAEGMIGDPDHPNEAAYAYQIQLDAGNNTPSAVALGVMQANVRVHYLSVIRTFLIDLEGGSTVVLNQQIAA